ncbi:MAG: hypothetical protein E2603_10060, partial [Achromobacter sp.]|nr:hypothetical protein [Achromobacter sp.]
MAGPVHRPGRGAAGFRLAVPRALPARTAAHAGPARRRLERHGRPRRTGLDVSEVNANLYDMLLVQDVKQPDQLVPALA